jgi:hypothetical protein
MAILSSNVKSRATRSQAARTSQPDRTRRLAFAATIRLGILLGPLTGKGKSTSMNTFGRVRSAGLQPRCVMRKPTTYGLKSNYPSGYIHLDAPTISMLQICEPQLAVDICVAPNAVVRTIR